MKIIILALATIALFTNCEVDKYLAVSGGSKANGTVELFYDYGSFQKPILHMEQGKAEASRRCQNWGYSGSEFFDVYTKKCITATTSGCSVWRVTYNCQCTE